MIELKLVLFTGFLGSGKTSLLLAGAKYLSERGIKSAIIVNEVGEIGIDNLQMKKFGYQVWELFGGCICCTLAASLEETIASLKDNYEVEIILMEPSGAADPGALYDPLKKNGFTKNKLKNLFILDPTRIEMFEAVLEPYLAAAIPLADEVVINKIDVATETEIEMAEAVIKNYKPELAGLKINVNEIKMDQLQELLKFK
ncbi:MAG: hypothetical protein PWP16_479 [Eubacteriaceae bacterium]|jgi:G3E family GTPase|nr:hypothetical protein [Eubacteriaceae bacterium]MDK2904782.1 hypothetical protein [Eubacteriaceae bacterium]MDK2935014.1 hypothetical protein [Eubacteriaceae bacterium]MDK2961697.1 hypothetical protein [Eubacteriaceae bacterium]MDN5307116.1 hypothetical protein [Eubacteriaceae bacterium]